MSTSLATLLVTLLNEPEPGKGTTDSRPGRANADGDKSDVDTVEVGPKSSRTVAIDRTGQFTHVEHDESESSSVEVQKSVL